MSSLIKTNDVNDREDVAYSVSQLVQIGKVMHLNHSSVAMHVCHPLYG